ncbi:hypothetical protein V1509DRAFT_452086 [Lipomyces kononenkoae]
MTSGTKPECRGGKPQRTTTQQLLAPKDECDSHSPFKDIYRQIKGTSRCRKKNNTVPAGVPRVVSLDPGMRTFMTGYIAEGAVIELGKDDNIGYIYRLCHRLDALYSRLSMKGLDHGSKWRIVTIWENKRDQSV